MLVLEGEQSMCDTVVPASATITQTPHLSTDEQRMPQEPVSNIVERVREKKKAYKLYNFAPFQEEAFATFFDLAQEYTSLESLYQICVAVPKEFLNLESQLYVIDPKTSHLEKVSTSQEGLLPAEKRSRFSLEFSDRFYDTAYSLVFPIRGNQALIQFMPFLANTPILGAFEVFPKDSVEDKNRLFLEKFTNRIGFNIHQKMLIQQNIDHIKFINQLVSDIEHNVISPNLYYKLFLIRMKKALAGYAHIQHQLRDVILFLQNRDDALSKELCEIHHTMDQNTESMAKEWRSLSKHYEHTSLFLETLFRRDHFEKGTYVLRKQSCNFRTEIIEPLLERYMPLFEQRGIAVDNRLENVPDEQMTLFVDKGLISQVFDNLFSNAVKYAQKVEDQLGNDIKLVSYYRQILRDFFGEGIHGLRFNFFTTGKTLLQEEAHKIFEEGYRASTVGQERGSGHGLHFVRNVVEIHGGTVGCEPQRYGNLIYFVLPMKEEKDIMDLSAAPSNT